MWDLLNIKIIELFLYFLILYPLPLNFIFVYLYFINCKINCFSFIYLDIFNKLQFNFITLFKLMLNFTKDGIKNTQQ